jgi:hypothetical protein
MSKKQPMQPIYMDGEQLRFHPNSIIRWLFDTGRIDMNDVSCAPFDIEDKAQLHQLLGLSVDGFAEIFPDDEARIEEVDQAADRVRRGVDQYTDTRRFSSSADCGVDRVVTTVAHESSMGGVSSKARLACGHVVVYKHCTSPLIAGSIKPGDVVQCHGMGCCEVCCPPHKGIPTPSAVVCNCVDNGCKATACTGSCGCPRCHLDYGDDLSSRTD